MEISSRTDTEIAWVLDKESGWRLVVRTMDGQTVRTQVNIPVSADLVITMANAIDQHVPQAAENAQRASVMIFAATATHRQLMALQRARAEQVARIAEMDRQAAAFRTTLIRTDPASTGQ